MTLYEVLGVSQYADKDHIKKAYRDLAKKYHPDANGGDPTVAEKFKEISNAYSILSDDQERIKYDASLVNPFMGQNGFDFNGDLSDLFNQMFGHNSDPRRRKGQDIRVTITLSFSDAFKGGPYRLDVNGQIVDFNLPAGVRTGQSFKLPGKGSINPYNSQAGPGDLIINTEVLMDSTYILRGDDIWIGYELPWWDLVLGTKIDVRTIDGSLLKVNVPAQSFSGKTLRLKDHGWPTSGSIYNSTNDRGALMIQLTATYPVINDEQLEILKKLKESIELER